MTIHELNNHLQQLTANPSRETAVEFSKALMQLLGVQSEQKEKTLGGYTQTLQKLLAENPRVKNQSLLYQLSSAAQNISCRFAVVKKINKPTLLRLCYQENFAQSWQANIGIAGTDKLPYTLDFITTEKYNAVTAVITQGEQIRTITFKEKLSNLQLNKILRVWQNIIAKPKAAINSDLWSSLDLKEVNKQFYISIKEKFDALIAEIKEQYPKAQPNEMKMFAIHLIGRYIFCWFLKEKEIIHPDVLSSASLEKYKDRYNKICKRLFFDTLNTFPFPERNYPKDVPAELLKHLSEIPYLNGGLFEPGMEDEIIPSLSIDGWLLSFIRLLEEYNFTVDESSANYEQVAIDPEMLGRILENLLASLNPETEKIANERNALGAFYTPRPIVDYMVTESLKVFFESVLADESKEENTDNDFFTTDKSKTDLFSDMQPKQIAIDVNKLAEQKESKEKLREKIDKLFDYTKEENPFNAADTRKLKQALSEVKIIDPACGSGAFPMGVLHKLEMLHEKFGTDKSPYDLRRMILSQNIYGVDILPMAVEISRLRAWLALVLVNEYKRSDKKHNFNIKALPNLDFKFMCANTLVRVPENEFVDLMAAADLKLFEELTEKYFSSNTDEKAELKEDIQKCIDNITGNHEVAIKQWIDHISKEKKSAPANKLKQMQEKLSMYEKQQKQWHSYKNIFAHGSVDFFDTKYFFPSVKNGFDIVIGNPPYIQLQDKTKLSEEIVNVYEQQKFRTFVRTGDIYCLFYEKGSELLTKKGLLCYITSNKWMRAEYGKATRKFFIEHLQPLLLIDFGQTMVFESAIVHSNILLLKSSRYNGTTTAVQFQDTLYKQGEDLNKFIATNSVVLKNLGETLWAIESDEKFGLKDKVEKFGTPLSEWNLNFFRGVLTGCNDAFVINSKEKNAFIKNDKRNANIIKPILRGRDVRRYYCNDSDSWLIFIPWHFPLHEEEIVGNSTKAETAFKKDYPYLFAHLLKFKKQLSDRNKSETGIRYEWYALQRCANTYYQYFEEEKIIFSEIVSEPQFHLDTKGIYPEATVFFITGDKLRFLIGLLNSKPVTYFYRKFYAGGELVGKYRYKKAFLERLPIPKPSSSQEKKIETLVEKILSAKNKNPQADTSKEERLIDVMVYHLYNLTYEEAKIIDATLSEEEWEKYKL